MGTLGVAAVWSPVLGDTIEYAYHLPDGYHQDRRRHPTLLLLHGMGQTRRVWERAIPDLEDLMERGLIPPLITIMPDAPWQGRASFWLDSRYTGSEGGGAGAPVETAITTDLLGAVDREFRTIPSRHARVVGGLSMGGAAALRLALTRQDLFGGAVVLSAAAYHPLPAAGSSTRSSGAYGVGGVLFDEDRYRELGNVAAFARVEPHLPLRLFIVAGDHERTYEQEAGEQNITVAAAGIHDRARRTPGVTSELRILAGGHTWQVWGPGLREGVAHVAADLADDDG